ncbi:MAG: peptide deformylase [Fusobacteriaceae bacterium]|jgi:peptide deformylase|nr:peptide deformylase [Fusobacteriaceae bacterium]
MYEVIKYGNEILREKAVTVTDINDDIRETLNEMVKTMIEYNGVGLAAPQVGINKRMFVCMVGEDTIKKIINPTIIPEDYETIEYEEGCLSIPGVYKNVKRFKKITLLYQDENGKNIKTHLEGFKAVVVQHENDHLDGILFVDKISPVAKRMIKKKLALLKKVAIKEDGDASGERFR